MIPEPWTELTLQTSPQFLEEIGFLSDVPSGHPISVLAKAKEYFRQQWKEHFRKPTSNASATVFSITMQVTHALTMEESTWK
jgi:hypothetical protein